MTNPENSSNATALKRALVALKDMRARLEAVEQAKTEPIAIIGMACRFPGGANTPEAFWQLLYNGIDPITEVPPERWNLEAVYDSNPETPGKMYARHGAFMKDVDLFDPQFFGISPREAMSMDPQQRLLLEVSWEALERAGLAPDKLSHNQTGVFLGISTNDYSNLQARPQHMSELDPYLGTGNADYIAAGRISYVLGLHGPNLALDTACSSSLVAVHLACHSLRAGEADVALAGGVNLMLSPDATIMMCKNRALAFDGHCKTFDKSADGYVRSEGCGLIVLKRLSDAKADGDNILALIRGTAINHDGRSSGLTVPSGPAQQRVIQAALADTGGLEAHQVDYVEAHGTGTPLGDPIEVRALAAALGQGRPADRPLMLGSVKTNIGHMEAAAGISGLMKIVLALQHKELPPHLHLKELNPYIDWPNLPVKVSADRTPWPAFDRPRIAGINSFGFSGTNAHVILEEAPEPENKPLEVDRPGQILSLSAKSEAALRQLAARFAQHLAEQPSLSPGDIAYTANTGRAHFNYRLALIANSTQQMQEKLAAWSSGQQPAEVNSGYTQSGSRPKIAFLFTGQGSQYVQMGRQLYDTQPVFRQTLNRCAEILQPYLERPLLEVLYPDLSGPDAQGNNNQLPITNYQSPIDETAYTQPALFALEYALAELWRSWGVVPSVVLGHSVGEYVAACQAGVFSLEDGLKLIAQRARLMQALPEGGQMAAVFADHETVLAAIKPYADQVSIAAVNGPQNIVISGAGQAVERIVVNLADTGVKSQRLTVSHAFHSPLMEPMLDPFKEVTASVRYAAPQIALISNVTGRLATEEITTAAYWQQHVRAPVRFAESIQFLQEQGYTLFVEIGPKPTLLSLGQRCWTESSSPTLAEPGKTPVGSAKWLPSLRPGREDWPQVLESLGELYVKGVEIDWAGFDRDYLEARRRIILPTYPFQRQRYWIETAKSQPAYNSRAAAPGTHPLLGQRLRSALKEKLFEASFSHDSHPFLVDHQVYGMAIMPATGYVEMGLAAARLLGADQPCLEEVAIQEALILPADKEQTVQVVVTPEGQDKASFNIFSLTETEEWKLHASGKIHPAQTGSESKPLSLASVQMACREALDVKSHYARLAEIGLEYGPAFQGIVQLWRGSDQALGRLQLAGAAGRDVGAYQLHPALLDACFQLLGAALPEAGEDETMVYLPVGLKRVILYTQAPGQLWGHVQVQAGDIKNQTNLTADVHLFDETGQTVAMIESLYLRRAPRELIQRAIQANLSDWLYEIGWEAQAQLQPSRTTPAQPGDWLIFADSSGVGAALAQRLRAQGEGCCLALPGKVYRQGEDGHVWINAENRADFQRLLQQAVGRKRPLRGVVYLWGVDAKTETATDQTLICGSTLHLIHSLADLPETISPRLWLVTRGSQPAGPEEFPLAVAQTPLWGLGGTIAQEHPNLQCVRLDLDPWPEGEETEALLAELEAPAGENQVALRGSKRYVARLVRSRSLDEVAARLTYPDSEAFQLDITTTGMLDNLALRPIDRRRPGPGEVEIQIRATGLNFRDVLKALGRYPGESGAFGDECAGVVVAVGDGVTEFQIGDEVVALVGSCFSAFAIAPARLVVPKPANLSFAEAVTIPVTFLTALYTLHNLAGMKAGDRVLIHAAAGGVGLAAVQLAQQAGAEIFATAGSPRKRALLRAMGVRHIMDSRTLEFADEIMRLTDSQGVDIVLNSLAGDFIPKSLSILSANGRFLEIGKTGIWDETQAAQLKPGVRYFAFFLGQIVQEQPELVRAMLLDLMAQMQAEKLKPLPLHLFSLDQAISAFRFMAQAKHIGKVVLTQEGQHPASTTASFEGEGTYLITGGLGGLGLKVAEWLAARGARHLVLIGRKAPTEAVQPNLRRLEEAGVHVFVAQADVSRQDQLADLLAAIEATMPPLRGVVHAAGVLDDGILSQQNWDRFTRVLKPKVEGAWHLHCLTQAKKLDFFVLFSSIASLVGPAGQGNYAAANAFLDGLAHYRRAQGLPALSLNWGPWAEVGMAASLDRTWAKTGVNLIAPEQGLQLLEQLLAQQTPQVTVLPIHWPKFGQQFSGSKPPLFSRLLDETRRPASADQPPLETANLLLQLAEASPAERQELLGDYVQRLVSKVFKLDQFGGLNPDQPLNELGLDSLMAVELKNKIETDFKISIALNHFLEGINSSQLTTLLLEKFIETIPAEAELNGLNGAAVNGTNAQELLANLDQLSDEQVDLLLSNLLTKDGAN